jgi:hypothetical protein
MFSKSNFVFHSCTSITTNKSNRPFAAALAAAILVVGSTSIASALTYNFLSVTGNNIPGNGAFSQFSGAKGVIPVSHSFSIGGAGPQDNDNAAIFPSQYTTVFPGTGNVQGHLAQTLYGNASIVTFDLTAYADTPTATVFGMWNTTDEVAQPAYRIELIDGFGNPVPPTTFTTFGTQDNTGGAGVNGRHQMVLNSLTGDITAGAVINGGIGIHTNALFWTGIPAGTQKIVVYGKLGPIPGNNQGDGVGYYFVEVVPEPASFALLSMGVLFAASYFGRSRRTTRHPA